MRYPTENTLESNGMDLTFEFLVVYCLTSSILFDEQRVAYATAITSSAYLSNRLVIWLKYVVSIPRSVSLSIPKSTIIYIDISIFSSRLRFLFAYVFVAGS
jgi:hypothetical protein